MERLTEERLPLAWGFEPLAVVRPDPETAGTPEAAGWAAYHGSGAALAYVTDPARGKVLKLDSGGVQPLGGSFLIGDTIGDDYNPEDGPWGIESRGRVSLWVRNGAGPGSRIVVAALVKTAGSADDVRVAYVLGGDALGQPAPDYAEEDCLFVYAPGPGLPGGADWLDGQWHYLELDLQGVLDALAPGAALEEVNGLIVRCEEAYVDDIIIAQGGLEKSYAVIPGAPVGGLLGAQAGGHAATAAGKDRWWYHTSDLGTVMAATDWQGNKIGVYQPDFFGNYRAVALSGQRPDAIGLSGKMYDADAGLYYYGARWYDPDRGRWTTMEPLGIDGPNMYQFVYGNPTGSFDQFGNETVIIFNRETEGNPFGHSAIGQYPHGRPDQARVWSFGNDYPLGGPLDPYLERELSRRNTTVIIINTCEEQEKRIVEKLESFSQDLPPLLWDGLLSLDTCGSRSASALSAGGLRSPFISWGNLLGLESIEPANLLWTGYYYMDLYGGMVIEIPRRRN